MRLYVAFTPHVLAEPARKVCVVIDANVVLCPWRAEDGSLRVLPGERWS
jgi:hypothetical protein